MDHPDIITAIESNRYELLIRAARLAGKGLYLGEDFTWVNSAPSRWPNGIFMAHFKAEECEEKVGAAIEQMRRNGAPRQWLTGPAYGPANLEATLERMEFRRRSETAGMALDMHDMRSNFAMPEGLEIRRVEDDLALREWARVVELGLFGLVEEQVGPFYETMSAARATTWLELFLGVYQGVPVASSLLYVANGLAGIYHVATLAAFRGRGIGRQITLAPVLRANELGCEQVILQATPAGAMVYRQIGFKEYSKLGRYYWMGD